MPAPASGPDSITAKTARGAGWLLGWRLATRALGFLSTLVLVRLLAPADFGVVALATSLAAAVDALSQLGVQEQLVREHATDRALLDTGFTLNLARAALTALLIAASASAVARFFAEPRLVPILLALALATFAGGLENIGIVEFRRAFSFEREFQLFVIPRLVSVLLAIAAAVWLRDFRALVVGIVAQRLLRDLASYALHPFRPQLSLVAWRRLVGFSAWSWGITVTAIVRDRCDAVAVGRVLGSAAVGVYAVGLEVAALPVTELIEPLARVLFSGFAAARRANTSRDAGYARVLGVLCLLLLPATTGISLLADPLMRLMFGPGWEGAIPLVQILAVGGVLRVFSLIGGTLLTAWGLPQETFRVTLVATCVRVPLVLLLVARAGLVGGAWGVLLATALEEALFVVVIARRAGLSAAALLAQVWRPVLAAAAMAAVLHLCHLGWLPSGGTRADLGATLLGGVALGSAVFPASIAALWFAAGRPRGAETELLGLLGAAARQFRPPAGARA